MLDNKLREDLLVTALEGGSNYWYFIPDLGNFKTKGLKSTAEAIFESIKSGNSFEIYDVEDPETFLGYLTLVDIERGEKIMKELCPQHYKNIKKNNWDAETADVWFQCAVMKDLVFG